MNCSRCGASLPARSMICAACGHSGPQVGSKGSVTSVTGEPGPSQRRLAEGARQSYSSVSVGAVGDHAAGDMARVADFGSYWSELNNEHFVRHGWEDVKGCEFVRTNKPYLDLADRIVLLTPPRSPPSHPSGPYAHPGNREAGSDRTPLIVYPMDHVQRTALISGCFSLMCVSDDRGRTELKRRLKVLVHEPAALLRREVHWLQRQQYEIGGLSIMREICFATVRVVLAHELGHHALHHLEGTRMVQEFSLNQEREADSFSSSVLHSLALRHACIVGVCLIHASNSMPKTPTHPASRERIRNYMEANPLAVAEACERYRLSREELESLFLEA